MNENQQAAYIMAQAACLNAEVAGMQAANAARIQAGAVLMYDERAFIDVLKNYCVDHNSVLGYFRS